MRNLTIKRTKRFVACLATMKVYAADPSSYDTIINNVPCRKIGELKNGEEKTFIIDNNPTRIFVIAGIMSKNYCNDFYDIPAGMDGENIYLSGKSHFNMANGNAFRFDGVTNPEVLENRKRGNKIGLMILSAAIILGLITGILIGIGRTSGGNKKFTSNGMSITLTNNFVKRNIQGYTACFDSKDVAVFTLKEGFELIDGFENYTVAEYGKLVLQANNFNSSVKLKTSGELLYFEYTFLNQENGETYHYTTFLYKADDAFWSIQFATLENKSSEYRQTIFDWASTVEF